jgi:tetratricopeptide (TPR) repeat protein
VAAVGIPAAVLTGSREQPSTPTSVAAPVVSQARPVVAGTSTEGTAGSVPTPAPEFAAADANRSGIAAYSGGDAQGALAQFSAAVEADPDNADALNNLGQILVKQGRAREAIPYFDRAVAAAGTVWAYHFNRARAYSELKEWRQAVQGYTDAARLFPDDYVTQFNLARARQADGDLDGAISAYAKAAELAPGQGEFQLWYGQALEQAGRREEAVAAYRRFLELQPDGPQAEKVKARLAQLS